MCASRPLNICTGRIHSAAFFCLFYVLTAIHTIIVELIWCIIKAKFIFSSCAEYISFGAGFAVLKVNNIHLDFPCFDWHQIVKAIVNIWTTSHHLFNLCGHVALSWCWGDRDEASSSEASLFDDNSAPWEETAGCPRQLGSGTAPLSTGTGVCVCVCVWSRMLIIPETVEQEQIPG